MGLKNVKKSESKVYFLTESPVFPPAHLANSEGLLAVGGDLSPERLIAAYRQGIFPWFNDDSLILWWSPDPRMVLFPSNLKVSASMQRIIKSGKFRVSQNQAFEEVVRQCAIVRRKGQPGSWITPEMQKAYLKLHKLGFAKSYEVWERDKLVGGLYGIDLGHVFCGESMFHRVSNASKFAFVRLVEDLKVKGYALIDCQVYNPHLESLGAEEVPRDRFLEILKGNNHGTIDKH
jgi:leucyl/phenylalanyl-tRNA--protein transferase